MSLHDADFRSSLGSTVLQRPEHKSVSGITPILRLGSSAMGRGASSVAARGLVVVLLLFALVHLLSRGPVDVKGNVNLCDFGSHYAAARAWLIGVNPYDSTLLPVVWQASWPGRMNVPLDHWIGLLPPGALALLAPLGALPAWAATGVWLMLSAGAVAASIAAALAIANLRANTLPGTMIIAAALAAAPFQTLVAVGQVSLLAVALILVSIACAQRGHGAWAGVLLAVAASFKPQLAAPFALFYLVYRNWRLVGCAIATGLAINLVGVVQLVWHGHDWLGNWTSNITASTLPGQPNDAAPSGPWRHQIVSLNVLLYGFVDTKATATLLNALLAGALIGTYAWLARRARFSADSLLSISILCAVSILPVYHRSYDAALLIVPFAWTLTSLRSAAGMVRVTTWAALVALSVFLIPFDALVLTEQKLGLFGGLVETWPWQAFVAPHHAWAALAACMCLIATLWLRVRRLGSVYDTDENAAEVIQLQAYQRADETADRWRVAQAPGSARARRTG